MQKIYKEIGLRSDIKEKIETEIMYEIASARADDVEFIRLDIESSADFVKTRKIIATVIRTLKAMKSDGRIQFFATDNNFKSMSTEAIFLINKYPNYFENIHPTKNGELFIYIKI